MTVRGLALGDLPRATASDLTAARALQSWLRAAPSPTTVQLPRLGAVAVAFEGVADRDAPTDPTDVTFGLECGGRWGRIALEGGFALRLVSATLGRAPDLAWRALGRSERGVLAAAIAGALTALGCELRLSLGASPELPAASFTVLLTVGALGVSAPVRLDIPPAWLSERVDAALDAQPLPLSGTLELASTKLSRAEWLGVRPGDAIVFDGYPPGSGDAWVTRLRVGPHVAEARLDVDGRVTLNDAFRLTPIRYPVHLSSPPRPLPRPLPRQESSMKDASSPETPSPSAGPDTGIEATSVLAAAPVEIVVEIGRLVLRSDEVLGLARGHVLTLGGARTTAVSLCVAGSVWARGELVDVDGELGVRVLEVSRR